jgi:membrane protein DedA with SNARE-associated domain
MHEFMILINDLVVTIKSGQLPQLGGWTYIILALLVAAEGPVATLLGAAAASAGLMRPIPVFFAAAAGNLTADTLWYTVGYMGKTEWILHFGRWLGLRKEQLERLEHNMVDHAAKVLFLAKLTLSFMVPCLIAAGLVRAPWRKWFPVVAAGEAIWTGSLVLIGFYATEALKRVEKGIEYFILFGSILFLLVIIWVGRRLLNQEE